MDVPDGMDVKVVENADNCVHITMPAPPSGHMELSDEELSNAAGGATNLTELCTDFQRTC
jgi:mersacidin/lichenicidin family type 2 lantibiotic